MDIMLEENGDEQMLQRSIDGQEEYENQDATTINMDIGIGVYDVNNKNFDDSTFKPSSTRPIVKFNGLIENEDEDDSSDEDSDDSNLYYEFNSDNENIDAASSSTKETMMSYSTSNQRPLIVDITPNIQQQNKSRKNKKRLRKQ